MSERGLEFKGGVAFVAEEATVAVSAVNNSWQFRS